MKEYIKKVRNTISATQEEFAQLIGVSIGTVRNWEQGRSRPNKFILEYIKGKYGVEE